MRFVRKILLSSLLMLTSPAFASEGNVENSPGGADSLNDLTTYLLNLGGYLGYNIQSSPTANDVSTGIPNKISQKLLNFAGTQVIENYLFNTYLGALLVNTAAQGATQFVPTNPPTPYSPINAFANYTFTTPPYNSSSQEQVSISTLIDQPTYQADPVSQAIWNILGTPDYSYCLNNDGDAFVSCTYPQGTLNDYQITLNAIGTIPTTQTYFSYNVNQPLLSQLNANSLLSPLLYSTTSSQGSSTSSGGGNTENQGLVATTQAQEAANFIRYATGAVAPMPRPNRNDYDNLFLKAQNLNNSYTQIQQQEAQATLANYLARMRIFAAQSSVGISNLYYMFSRRLPQNQSTSSSGRATSEALSEFVMATWRLYNPENQTPNKQWLTQINNASAATVHKEMVILLAEINYQLYLSRQQQERLLLTQSMLLIQNNRVSEPTPSLAMPNYQTNEKPRN